MVQMEHRKRWDNYKKETLIHDNGFIPNGYCALLWRAWMLESPTNHNSKWGSLPGATGFPNRRIPDYWPLSKDIETALIGVQPPVTPVRRPPPPGRATEWFTWIKRRYKMGWTLYTSDTQWPSCTKQGSPHLRKKVCMANNMFLRS